MRPDFTVLTDRCVVLWIGAEMAISSSEESGVVWSHPTVPYLQFDRIDAYLEDGDVFQFVSQLDDGSDHFGLYRGKVAEHLSVTSINQDAYFRCRVINELPIGKVTEVHTTVDAKANVLDLRLVIADQFVQLNSGEIDEHTAGRYIARMPDESILVVTGRNA